jgi:hypothetical protein
MTFYEEISKIQLYSDEIVTNFKNQLLNIFSKLILPQVKKAIKISAFVGLTNTECIEYIYITSTSSHDELNTILLILPSDLGKSEIMEKLFDIYSIGILSDLLEKELGKEFNIKVNITKDDFKQYKIKIFTSWHKSLL